MKNNKHEQNELQRMMEGRAARMIAAAVTVFLCVLTLFEFVALKMEWNVPALAVLSGDNGLWTREYQREELVMDGSTENILLADDGETPLTGSGENAKTNVGENGSGGTAQTGENAGNGEDLQVEGTEAVRQEETETPDVSGTGKAEADVKETQTPEFSYYIRINRKQNCVTIYTQDEEGEYTVPIRQWYARPDFTTQRRAELTRFPPSICGGNSMAVCMGSTRRGFTGESCSILCPITSAQRIHSVRTSITSWDSRRRWAA